MDPDREDYLRRVRDRMDRIDKLPKDVREVIHEHGLTVVDALLTAGVTKGRVMRHLIAVIRQGSSAWGNGTRGSDQLWEFERSAREQLQRRSLLGRTVSQGQEVGSADAEVGKAHLAVEQRPID